MKVAVKKPGLEMTPIMSELDLTYKVRAAAIVSYYKDDGIEDISSIQNDCVQR